MSDEKLVEKKENCSIETLICLQVAECSFAYDIIKENMDINALSPSDKNIIDKLKTVKTLHRIRNCLTKVKEVVG